MKRVFDTFGSAITSSMGLPSTIFQDKGGMVDITDASQWFFEENDQEVYDWAEDFPTVMPPWPMTWLEFRSPSFMRSEGTVKPYPKHIISHHAAILWPIEFEEKYREEALLHDYGSALIAAGAIQNDLMSKDQATRLFWDNPKSKKRREQLASLHEQGFRSRWFLFGVFFSFNMRKRRIFELARTAVYLDEYGRCIRDSSAVIPGHEAITLFPEVSPDRLVSNMISVTFPFFFSLSLMHCKNVVLQDIPSPPTAVQKKRKRKGQATFRYKELMIDPMRKQVKNELADSPDSEETPIQRALHICRGHFKDYREGAGLFGKLHDIYWWEIQLRGTREAGEIKKTYNVASPSSEKEA